jgi:hypothetical protein
VDFAELLFDRRIGGAGPTGIGVTLRCTIFFAPLFLVEAVVTDNLAMSTVIFRAVGGSFSIRSANKLIAVV